MANTQGLDPTFGVNNFNEPKILSETETYAKNLLLLLMGRPGFYPSQPSLGMDIKQYFYKFEDEIDTAGIKSKLVKQCNDFLPEVQTGEFEVYVSHIKDKPLLIFVLPVIYDETHISLTLGVTVNDKGELIYKFVENKKQLL